MPGIRDRAKLARRPTRPDDRPPRRDGDRPPRRDGDGRAGAPGGFSYGTSLHGGPIFSDAFHSRRAPSPWQLVEKYKSLIYAMTQRNASAVSRVPLRLYADGSRVQGKPARACDPIRVSRHVGQRLARSDASISAAAVDQIYEVRNHPVLDLLDDPDRQGYFDRKKLIGLLVAYMDVVGSSYLVPEGNGWDWRDAGPQPARKGPPEYLWVIYPQYVIPFRDAGSNMIRSWQYFRDRIRFDNVLWFRHTVSLRDAYGSAYSPTYAGDLYADQEDRFCAIWDQVLGLGPRPNVIASAKDPNLPPGEAERRRLEQDFARRDSGGNAGGLWVNTGSWEFTPISYAPADLAAKEINEYNLYRLASIFGQPPTYYTVDTNLANLQAADVQHARMGVEPRCDTIASKLTHMVRAMDPRLSFRFDPVLPEDDEARAKVIDMRLRNGSLTINQANEEERWPRVDWGDEPWLPGTLVQPSMAREKHEQGLEQGQAAMEGQKRRDDFELVEAAPGDDQDEGEPTQGTGGGRRIDAAHGPTLESIARRAGRLTERMRGLAS